MTSSSILPDRPSRLACAGIVLLTCVISFGLVGLATSLSWLLLAEITLGATAFAFLFPRVFYVLAQILRAVA